MAPNGFASPVASCTSSTSDLVSPLDETFSLPGMAGNFPLPNEMYSPVVHGPESYVHDGSKPDYAMQAFQYAPCWQDPSLFSSNEMLFSSDFDVNNVPSVELGLPKMNENSVAFPSHYGSLDGQGQYTEFSQPGQHHNADAMGGPYARIFHDYHDDTGHY
ncbi:hypothetical protein GLOTRDRAFT_112634 [Gloeophyllum trabeum ATCC 11539]|uniref:Uncharacterized protein n=1 Tax=Gloeophyllum trabeum (strain ATCC 11539 / FP-39264 / Madison 617) TaxID=670483 RepID=S7PU82_GLOTA|nr:uncharacterized protein GLOTRDRAFT_112634 [Gloeophyllum trabeum ATCC 11539]EPQ50887.1 hypothetical protein GLOTRDRAFT_112634 [Gloeophyllum trabeum ATCC 11539]